jgi:hypothetical protein
MSNEWHELTDLTGERHFVVTQVKLDSGVRIDGEFELPTIAQLRYEDQVFVSMFVRSHGSIKEMEKAFSISYPTVKNRLNRIAAQLRLVEVNEAPEPQAQPSPAPAETGDILGMLERGEISADEATRRLRR